MRFVFITSGSGRMECDACLRDAWLARAFRARGHDVVFIPTYTPPLESAEETVGEHPIFYGGINVYLREKYPSFRFAPRFVQNLLDNKHLLKLSAKLGDMTDPEGLADLTISVLMGKDGPHASEIKRVLDYLEALPRPDFFLLPNSLFAGLAEPLHKRFSLPVLCLLSGEDTFLEQFTHPDLQHAKDILRKQAAHIDGFIAPSHYYADFMQEYLQAPAVKMHVVPQGIDLQGYHQSPRPRSATPHRFIIGYRSPICPANGLHVLIEAFHLLKKNTDTSGCQLRCAGFLNGADKAYFAEIKSQIREWGYEQDFSYVGELTPTDRIAFLRGIDTLCVPTTYPEPIGSFVPEALAAAVPVVVSQHGCLPEWMEATHGGVLVPPCDPKALSKALRMLMLNRSDAAEMGREGQRAIFEKFNAEQTVIGFEEVFVNLG